MELSNDSKTVDVPIDIKVAIDNYKNQATLLGLEVERVRRLKSQIEIEISNLSSLEVSKIERTRALDEKIKKQLEQIDEFEVKKAEILKERMEFDQFKIEENKKIAEREAKVKSTEEAIEKQKNKNENNQKTLDASIARYELLLTEVTKKKEFINELSKKL